MTSIFFGADKKLQKIIQIVLYKRFSKKKFKLDFLKAKQNIFNLVTEMKIFEQIEYFIFVKTLDNENIKETFIVKI